MDRVIRGGNPRDGVVALLARFFSTYFPAKINRKIHDTYRALVNLSEREARIRACSPESTGGDIDGEGDVVAKGASRRRRRRTRHPYGSSGLCCLVECPSQFRHPSINCRSHHIRVIPIMHPSKTKHRPIHDSSSSIIIPTMYIFFFSTSIRVCILMQYISSRSNNKKPLIYGVDRPATRILVVGTNQSIKAASILHHVASILRSVDMTRNIGALTPRL